MWGAGRGRAALKTAAEGQPALQRPDGGPPVWAGKAETFPWSLWRVLGQHLPAQGPYLSFENMLHKSLSVLRNLEMQIIMKTKRNSFAWRSPPYPFYWAGPDLECQDPEWVLRRTSTLDSSPGLCHWGADRAPLTPGTPVPLGLARSLCC